MHIFDLPMPVERLQEVHYAALRIAASGEHADFIPGHIIPADLRQKARTFGGDVFLIHPADLEHIFNGFTFRHYQMIDGLYCSRDGRSPQSVWHLLHATGTRETLSYEAVWAVCMYLEDVLQKKSGIPLIYSNEPWFITVVQPHLQIVTQDRRISQPAIVCIWTDDPPRVLAYHPALPDISNAAAHALFKAMSTSWDYTTPGVQLNSQYVALYDGSIPTKNTGAVRSGTLFWRLPRAIHIMLEHAQTIVDPCRRMRIPILFLTCPVTPIPSLRQDWARDLRGRTLSLQSMLDYFDTALYKCDGYSPLRSQKAPPKYPFDSATVYQPSELFPLLRLCIPPQPATVETDGVIRYGDLHFWASFLSQHAGCSLTVRHCPDQVFKVWIYDSENALGAATARELRRTDGSYRSDPKWRYE